MGESAGNEKRPCEGALSCLRGAKEKMYLIRFSLVLHALISPSY